MNGQERCLISKRMERNMENYVPQKERILTDEEFMGKWEADSKRWILLPKINYDADHDLKKVKEYVKSGDYTNAKKELLCFYRRTGRQFHQRSVYRKQQKEILELQMEDIYSTIPVWAKGSIQGEDSELELDLTEVVKERVRQHVDFFSAMLMAEEKNREVIFSSRRGNKPPKCVICTQEKEYVLYASADTYIRAGKFAHCNYGTETELKIEESGYPYDDEMKRAYVQFDLPEKLQADKILSVTVLLYGGVKDSGPIHVIAFESEDTFVVEKEKTMANSNMKVLSYYKREHPYTGFDYTIAYREGLDNQFFNVISRFWNAMGFVEEYEQTGQECYANRFIQESLNYYTSLGGGESLVPESQRSNGPALNTGFRTPQMIEAYYILLHSRSMTPDTNLQMLKMFYEEREFLYQDAVFWGHHASQNNWGMMQTIAQFYICCYFPEFEGFDRHQQEIMKRMSHLINTLILDDGSYIEATLGYPVEIIDILLCFRKFAKELNLPLPDILERKLYLFARYFRDCTDSAFEITEYGDCHYRKNTKKIRALLEEASEIYQDPTILYAATEGKKGMCPEQELEAVYPYGKLATFRTGWSSEDIFCFTNWKPGASHAHNDSLSFTVTIGKNRLLTDNGDRSYNKEPIANWQRFGRYSHNVCCIDDRTAYEGWGPELKNVSGDGAALFTETENLIQGCFRERIGEKEQKHIRKLLFIKPLRVFLVVDHLVSDGEEGEHVYSQNWQFEPTADMTLEEDTFITHFNDGWNVQVRGSLDQTDEIHVEKSYYERETSLRGEIVRKTDEKSTAFFTVVLPVGEENTEILSVSRAKESCYAQYGNAFRFTLKKQETIYYGYMYSSIGKMEMEKIDDQIFCAEMKCVITNECSKEEPPTVIYQFTKGNV